MAMAGFPPDGGQRAHGGRSGVALMTPSAALQAGLSIIPTGPDKRPLIYTWRPYQTRLPTAAEFAAWSQMNPPTWAIVTGKVSRRIALDFDGELGRQTLERLGLKAHRRSPSGGYHVDFVHPGWPVSTVNGKSARELGELWPGLDIRGDGGYVCFSGTTDRGQYEWLRDPEPYTLDILPADLRRFLGLLHPPAAQQNGGKPHAAPPAGRVDTERLIRMALDRVCHGGRNQAGFWLASQLRDNGYSFSEAEACMQSYRTLCPDKNAKGLPEPYTEHEIRATLKEVFSRAAREPWSSAAPPPQPEEEPGSRPRTARVDDCQAKEAADAEASVTQWPAPLKPAAFYGIVGDLVDVYRPHSEADDAAILIQFLVAVGNMIGRIPHFYAQGTRHHLNLNCVLTGATARGRKGSSFDQVMLPLRQVDPVWSENRVASGLSSGEGLIYKVRDPIEKQEPIKEKGRITGYRTVIADHGVEDKRLLVVEPEFARVLQVIEREANTLSPVIRQAWDTGNLGNLTKNSPLTATGAHISIIGHITKAELDRLLTDTALANGFANRFLWLCVKRSKLLPEGGQLHRMDLSPFSRQLTAIVNQARTMGEMQRDPALREQWADFYARCARGGTGLFDAATNRAEAQTMRLACTYAYLDQCQTVKAPHLDAAIAVWTFCEDSARFLFGNKLGDPTADQILGALRNAGSQGLTRADINHLFQRHKAETEIQRALGVLSGLGLIRSEKEETAGRPVTRYFAL
jgi:hypothetical protein